MKGALPPASNDTLNADATTLGLINAPNSSVTSTVVGTETVTSSVTTALQRSWSGLTTHISATPERQKWARGASST